MNVCVTLFPRKVTFRGPGGRGFSTSLCGTLCCPRQAPLCLSARVSVAPPPLSLQQGSWAGLALQARLCGVQHASTSDRRGRGGACSHLLPNLLRAPGFMFSEKTLLCGQLRGKDCREEGRSCWLPPKILGGPGRGPIHRVFPEPGAQGPTQEDSEEAPGEGLCRAVETGLSRQGSVSSRPCRMITPSGVLSPRSGATSPAPLSGRHPHPHRREAGSRLPETRAEENASGPFPDVPVFGGSPATWPRGL